MKRTKLQTRRIRDLAERENPWILVHSDEAHETVRGFDGAVIRTQELHRFERPVPFKGTTRTVVAHTLDQALNACEAEAERLDALEASEQTTVPTHEGVANTRSY